MSHKILSSSVLGCKILCITPLRNKSKVDVKLMSGQAILLKV